MKFSATFYRYFLQSTLLSKTLPRLLAARAAPGKPHCAQPPLARGWPRRGPAAEAAAAARRCSAARGPREPRGAPACGGRRGPEWAARRVLAKPPALPRPLAGMSDGDNRCKRGVRGFSGVPEFGASGPRGQSLTLETALLALHQPSEVAPQPASCSLVKPEVTSTSRNPPVLGAEFSPKGRREEGVRCMVLCITVRALLPSRRKAGESGCRAKPSSAHHTPTPTLGHSSPQTAQLGDHGPQPKPPARAAPRLAAPARPTARGDVACSSPPHPPPPGCRFRPRVRACAPAAATAAVTARGSVRQETWCCFLGVKVLSNFGFLFLSPGF